MFWVRGTSFVGTSFLIFNSSVPCFCNQSTSIFFLATHRFEFEFFYFQTWFRKTLVLLVKLERNEFLMRQIGTEEISSLSKLVKLTVAEVSRDFLTLILNPFPGDFQNALGPGPRGRAASTPYTARINFEYWAHHYLNRKFESFKIRCLEKIILNLRESDWKENLIF